MKPTFLFPFALGLTLLSAEPTTTGMQPAVNLPDPATIRFTPPPPPKEIPRFKVKGANVADFGTHRVTILRGEPSTLPDVPVQPAVEPCLESPKEPVEPCKVLYISGCTYQENLSCINIWNPITETQHTAWCGWDISLIAPFHEIFHEGMPYLLLMGVGPSAMEEDSPKVEPGAILVPDGDAYTAALMSSLRDACFQHKPQLLALKTAREKFQKDSAAWHAAHPSRPQNHTIWVKPHRGSRYLENPSSSSKEEKR